MNIGSCSKQQEGACPRVQFKLLYTTKIGKTPTLKLYLQGY